MKPYENKWTLTNNQDLDQSTKKGFRVISNFVIVAPDLLVVGDKIPKYGGKLDYEPVSFCGRASLANKIISFFC